MFGGGPGGQDPGFPAGGVGSRTLQSLEAASETGTQQPPKAASKAGTQQFLEAAWDHDPIMKASQALQPEPVGVVKVEAPYFSRRSWGRGKDDVDCFCFTSSVECLQTQT